MAKVLLRVAWQSGDTNLGFLVSSVLRPLIAKNICPIRREPVLLPIHLIFLSSHLGRSLHSFACFCLQVQNSLQLLPDSLKLPVPDPELSSEAQILGLSNEDEEEETAVVIEQVEEKNRSSFCSFPPHSTGLESPNNTHLCSHSSRCQVSSPSPPPQLRRSHRCQLGAQ